MFAWLKKALWGGPVRRVVTVLTPLALLPFWIANYETFLKERGLDRLLVDPGPLAQATAFLLSVIFSARFQWAVIGALVALLIDGWFRFREASPVIDHGALYDSVSRAHRQAGFSVNNKNMRSAQTIGEIESAYHALKKLGVPVPDRGETPEQHFMQAYYYLGAIVPLIRDRHIDGAREMAREAIAALNNVDQNAPGAKA